MASSFLRLPRAFHRARAPLALRRLHTERVGEFVYVEAAPKPAKQPEPEVPVEEPVEDLMTSDKSANWFTSFSGLSVAPFENAEALTAPVDPQHITLKSDGYVYLAEPEYRRRLDMAFGEKGWGLAVRSKPSDGPSIVSREYALICKGRFVAAARGEQRYTYPAGKEEATEAVKLSALMRCCKDLGVASELWDPRFVRDFKAKHCVEVWVTETASGKKKRMWRRKDAPKFSGALVES